MKLQISLVVFFNLVITLPAYTEARDGFKLIKYTMYGDTSSKSAENPSGFLERPIFRDPDTGAIGMVSIVSDSDIRSVYECDVIDTSTETQTVHPGPVYYPDSSRLGNLINKVVDVFGSSTYETTKYSKGHVITYNKKDCFTGQRHYFNREVVSPILTRAEIKKDQCVPLSQMNPAETSCLNAQLAEYSKAIRESGVSFYPGHGTEGQVFSPTIQLLEDATRKLKSNFDLLASNGLNPNFLNFKLNPLLLKDGSCLGIKADSIRIHLEKLSPKIEECAGLYQKSKMSDACDQIKKEFNKVETSDLKREKLEISRQSSIVVYDGKSISSKGGTESCSFANW